MTLYRQLLVTMLALFATLFVAAYLVQFNSTRAYLAGQLELSVTSTANSLGLALTPYLETGDAVGAESVINAAFDGGFYRRLRLDLLASQSVIQRENSADIQGVPQWFLSLQLFKPVSFESILTSGWLQLGKLRVEGHPGQAYYELWNGMSRLFIAFVVTFLLVTVLLMRALQYLLRPLDEICVQATEIEQHHFGHVIPLPRTLELRKVVQAINTMATKLAQQFKEQAEAAEQLRERAFRDAVSGLGNRAYFVGQVNAWLAESGQGGIMLVAVDMLDEVYREEGYAARDSMVKAVANSMQDVLKVYPGHALARISATEYAVLLPALEIGELAEVADQLNRSIAELVINPIERDIAISVIGVAPRERHDDLSVMLTKADSALRRARSERLGTVVVDSRGQHDDIGRLGWRDLLLNALHSKQLVFKVQPAILLANQQPHHAELFTSIHRDGEDFFAGQFMPAVEQFKLGSEFDRYVLEQIGDELSRHKGLRLAVNLTQHAISSAAFHEWLDAFLVAHGSLAGRLFLELPESAIVHARDHVETLLQIIRRHKFEWGVDQYGRNFQSLDYLESLHPAYVKIDHGYTGMVLKEEGDQAFLSAVCRAAHNAGIVTIATRVESQEQVNALSRLFVDGYQGFISPPYPLG
ncbi:EAL domain-containing protein [Pseudaeromonas sharmana]|uniref:EAL domain-containing protein n=1 Tax=Pseudaeromonas sharmana TaxID=328412 RepID=A0ABV8CJI1_9GAMM